MLNDSVPRIDELKVKLFADGADLAAIKELAEKPYIRGFTTNPTLMRMAGIADYRTFAREVLGLITDRPISFEVFSDSFAEMKRQALEIASWGRNVYVKIPVTNTKGTPSHELVRSLSQSGVQVNVTAIMTDEQVRRVADAIRGGAPACVSVFAGRIADTGRDPMPVMRSSLRLLEDNPRAELIWASPRELFNVFQANEIGCHIITATSDILRKLTGAGKDLHEFSLETVRMFHEDAKHAGYSI